MGKNQKKGMVITGISLVGGLAAATQSLAASVQYHPDLGSALFHYGNIPIYMPYKYLVWTYKFNEILPIAIVDAMPYLIVPMIVGSMAGAIIARKGVQNTSHGSAQWAQYPEDYINAGVLPKNEDFQVFKGLPIPKGVFIGQAEDGRYIADNSNTHMLLAAPTRSGKGTSTANPTCLTWEESMVVNDLKGELWRKSAWTRKKMGHIVCCFNPVCGDGTATPKNPLDEIRVRTVNELRDVANIAEILVDPTGEKKQQDFWDSTAKAFITAIILHLKYTMKNPSFTDVGNFMRDTSSPLDERLMRFLEYPHDPTGKLFMEIYQQDTVTHPEVAMGFRSFLNTPEETRGGILKSAETFLDLFNDPLIRKNTSTSGFMIDDLVHNERPMTLYISINANDLIRLKPLLRLMIVQIIGKLTSPEYLEDEDLQTENDKKKHRLLLLLDEFANLGKLAIIESALSYMAGFGIKGVIIIQDLQQLKNVYGQNNQIVSGCHTRVFHAPNELVTGKYVSDELGMATIKTKSVQYSGTKWLSKNNITESFIGRPLLRPEEITQLGENQQIVFVTRNKPMLINKNWYYKDETFKSRMGTREERLAVKSDYIHHDDDE